VDVKGVVFERFSTSGSLFVFVGVCEGKLEKVVFEDVDVGGCVVLVGGMSNVGLTNVSIVSSNSKQDLFGVASSVCSVNFEKIKIEGVELEEGSILRVCTVFSGFASMLGRVGRTERCGSPFLHLCTEIVILRLLRPSPLF
jgi:hypothetical protein